MPPCGRWPLPVAMDGMSMTAREQEQTTLRLRLRRAQPGEAGEGGEVRRGTVGRAKEMPRLCWQTSRRHLRAVSESNGQINFLQENPHHPERE